MKRFSFKRILLLLPPALILLSLLQVAVLKWVPVTYTPLMLKRFLVGDGVRIYREWVPLERISLNMERAVIASEDQKFCTHNGFDFDELEKMREKHQKKGGKLRGCSTISQQTAKNCFTFCTHTWFRKGVEAYYTFLIEHLWGKRRIMEVYLNIAEMGPGLFGVEAASRKYFSKKASALSASEAAALACCLPNPLRRNPVWVGRWMPSRRQEVEQMMYYVDVRPLK